MRPLTSHVAGQGDEGVTGLEQVHQGGSVSFIASWVGFSGAPTTAVIFCGKMRFGTLADRTGERWEGGSCDGREP